MDDTLRASRMQVTDVLEDAWFSVVFLLCLRTIARGGSVRTIARGGCVRTIARGGWWEPFLLQVSNPPLFLLGRSRKTITIGTVILVMLLQLLGR